MIYSNYVKQSPVLGLTSGAGGGASLSYFTHVVAAPPGGDDSGSVQFDGADDHLNITGQSDLAFGSGDFTLEFWVYFTDSDPTLDCIMETRSTTSASDGFLIGRFHTSGYENKIVLYTAGGYRIDSNSAVSNNTWVHVAVVRSGSTTKMYIDGVAQSTTYSDSNNYSNGGLIIGENANNTYQIHGLISNFRMIKGTAVYTSSFNVPISPLTEVTNTKLLCCNSTTSATGSTITPGTIVNNGGATVSTSNPFDFGSVLFDQTSDYLTLSDSNDFNLGTGDFTIECFVKPETLNTSAYSAGFSTILDHDGGAGSYAGAWFAIHQNNNQIYWASNNANQINGGTLSLSWNHIAVVRSGSTTTLYVNGSSVANYTDNLNYTDSYTRGLYIGTQNGTNRRFGGYISNLRLVKGTAVYSGNFTPPTSPLTDVTNTKLLCCQSSISATAAAVSPGTILNYGSTVDSSVPFGAILPSSAVFYAKGGDFTDSGPNAYTITKVGGNLTVSNSVSKSGGGSFDFDGFDSEQYFYAGNNTFLNDSLSSWQFQCWARYTNGSGQAGNSSGDMGILVDQYPGSGSQGRLLFGFQSDALVMRVNGGTVELTSGSILSNNTWYHVLLNWDGTTHRLFTDGILRDSSTTVPAVYTGKRTEFGGGGDLSGYNLHGYMEHVLVENGGTVKTSNFTPNNTGFVT